jgi:hypothetical protein
LSSSTLTYSASCHHERQDLFTCLADMVVWLTPFPYLFSGVRHLLGNSEFFTSNSEVLLISDRLPHQYSYRCRRLLLFLLLHLTSILAYYSAKLGRALVLIALPICCD